ncbi:MAG TPA: hypothetical protein VGN41_11700, partial [Streptosporangiaceae bacterium]
GSSRLRHMPVVDPDIVRGLGVGQAAYVHQGGVTFVQVKRLVAAPAALSRVPAAAQAPAARAPAAAGAPAAARPAPPPPGTPADVTAFLDEAFGPETGPRAEEAT